MVSSGLTHSHFELARAAASAIAKTAALYSCLLARGMYRQVIVQCSRVVPAAVPPVAEHGHVFTALTIQRNVAVLARDAVDALTIRNLSVRSPLKDRAFAHV